MKTTLNKIKNANACTERYKVLLASLGKTEADDEELTIKQILDSNGVKDAIWALQTVKGHDKEIRMFDCDCAEMVLSIFEKHYPNDDRPRRAIEVSRMFINGDATGKELDAAGDAAWAASEAAWAAAWAAAGAAAWSAAWAAARDAALADIEKLLLKYI
jgi:hypothetical protein